MPMLEPMTELEQTHQELWNAFLDLMKQRCSKTEYENWFSSIRVKEGNHPGLVLEVPNIFVREYLNANYKNELSSIVPKNTDGSPQIEFVIAEAATVGREKEAQKIAQKISIEPVDHGIGEDKRPQLNQFYHFETFVEGPSNQFVKSAALGVAMRPGKSYNPLFIHGGVGLGKTHLLHAIGHHILANNKKLRIQCITTEQFINDLVLNLRNKSVDKMKQFYRSLDVLLVDDIQFLQSRLNFEDEFCNTFESLINQNKQIVITSDKPPTQLKLSERLIARMEWGLVANVGIPELETRVAIIQNKAEGRGLKISSRVAFYIAERIFHNVRQLEGALNRLSAYCRIMKQEVTEEIVEQTLSELLHHAPQKRVSVEGILKTVASIFEVRVSDLRGTDRSKEIAFPRQVAMYLAKELINESLMKIAASFGGKTHSTLLHSWKKISEQLENDELLRRQIQMARRNLEA